MNRVTSHILSLTLTLGLVAPVMAQDAPTPTPTAEELLAAMDKNLQNESSSSTMTMTVDDGRRTREYELVAFSRGQEESAVEYVKPAREKGTRMLKKGDELWLYLPRAERVQKISGHMMRQGMMGSDVSYEDVLAASDFAKRYDAKVEGSVTLEGRPHWKLVATARDKKVTYPKRIIWIDAEYLTPTRQELYALSGVLLKTWTMTDVKEIDGKMYPTRTEIRDELRKGSKTVIVTRDIKFGVSLRGEMFSRRWLERGR